MAEEKNPCMSCDVGQRCCATLHDLRLSEREFEQSFRRIADRLEVVKYRKSFLVTPKDRLPCPYWTGKGCSIYESRPIDCRLFPYVLVDVRDKGRKIRVTFHKDSDCPHREDLYGLVPLDEAKSLMKRLAQDVFGQKEVEFEEVQGGADEPKAVRLVKGLITRASKRLRAYR
ncbi:MAG: YkgJ family cysteine cluster protein [Deltaproteobacteria bacterium]|nr:YkgJ family cysteine cluster protein [Deltaproteobacteria bacterium]